MDKLSQPASIPKHSHFIGFDVEEPWFVPGYRRNLHHLRLAGATYFVTFRLADSIPESVAQRWQAEHHQWQQAHGIDPDCETSDPMLWMKAYNTIPLSERRVFEREQQRRFFIELDKCHGSCLLEKAPAIIANALEFFHGKRLWLSDYVVMPNHVHVLVQPFPGVKLEEWLYSIKRFTSTEMNKHDSINAHAIMRQGHLWQTESFDRIVRDEHELARIRQYIANNPAKLRSGMYALKQMDWLDAYASRSTPT